MVEDLKLAFVFLSEIFNTMRVFKHVEMVNQVKLLVPTFTHIKLKLLFHLILLLKFNQFHELFRFNGALPCLHLPIVKCN
jgi:hypothetical protein